MRTDVTGPSPHVFHALQRQALAQLGTELPPVTHLDALEASASVHLDLEGLKSRMSVGAFAELIHALAALYDEAHDAGETERTKK